MNAAGWAGLLGTIATFVGAYAIWALTRQHRWAAPLVVGSVVCLLAAIVVGLVGSPDSSSAGASPVPTTPATTARASSSQSSPSPSPSASAAAHSVRYGPGEIRLGDADLDTVPPTVNAQQGGDDVHPGPASITTLGAYNSAQIAPWDGRNPPGAEDCDDLITRKGRMYLENVTEGDVVCVRTDEGALAALTVIRLERNTLDSAVLASVTIWT